MSYVVLVVSALNVAPNRRSTCCADLISPFSRSSLSAAPLVDVLKVVEKAAATAGSHRWLKVTVRSGSTSRSRRGREYPLFVRNCLAMTLN